MTVESVLSFFIVVTGVFNRSVSSVSSAWSAAINALVPPGMDGQLVGRDYDITML